MNKQITKHLTISLLAAVFGFAAPVNAATTDLATEPMAITGSTSIKPNLLFLLDDSGSMAWDRLSPDTMANTNSNTDLCYMNNAFNGVYYNPGLTYVLPVTSTGANYPNSTFTAAKDDGFDISSPVITNLSTGFATGGNSNNSISGPGAFYYTYHRIPPTTTLTVSGSSSTTVSSIKVNGIQLMSATSTGSSTNSIEAFNIATKITLNGFSATSLGSIVTIIGPASAGTFTPIITKSGSDSITAAGSFSADTPITPVTGTCYPDANYTRVNVTSASAEAQNFANWYSYYRTRILTMKSAAGLAFKNIDSSFRVGFSKINSITGGSPLDVNISDFDATQRALWYADFYAVVPNNSTPLRVALADAGRIFAHKLAGAADPMQYSCQQNFTIMTTDGMWNEPANPKQVDGATDIGNQDNTAPRPMFDGSSYVKTTKQNQQDQSTIFSNTTQLQALQIQSSTSALQSSTANLQSLTWPLQSSTSVLQSSAWPLQSSTSVLQSSAWPLQSSTSVLQSSAWSLQSSTSVLQSSVWSLQSSTSVLQVQTGQLQKATSADGGVTWTAWSNAASCTWDNTSSSRTKCQYLAMSAFSNAAGTCTAVDQSGSTSSGTTWTGNKTNCQYTAYTTPAAAGSCTYKNQSGGSPYSVLTATTCSYGATATVTTVTSCTASAKSTLTTDGTVWNPAAKTCGYTAYSVAAPAGSCTYQNQSGGSPYAGPAVTCSYGATPTVTTVPSCTNVAKSSSTANGAVWDPTAHTCGYGSYSVAAPAGSCTYQNQSGGSPYAGPAVTCSYGATPTVTTVTSCTNVAKSSSTANGAVWDPTAHTCGYGSYSAVAPAGSCTYQNQSGGSPYAGPAVTCSYGATQTVATVPSCTPVAKSSSTANGAVWDPTAHTCGYSAYSTPANVSSCTAAAPSGASPYTVAIATNCTYTAFTAWANASSCTTVAKSTAPNYTVGTATQCQTAWLGVNTCTVGVGGQTACQTVVGSTTVASCAPITASSANNWTTTSCSTTTTPWVGVSSCTAAAASAGNGYVATNCNPANPVTTITNVSSCTAAAATAVNNWTTTTCGALTGGTPNTLADVAYYYWETDLRTAGLGNCTGLLGTDVCFNNVRGSGSDVNSQQHMTTFTLGLGVVGTLNPDGYPTLSTDYNNLTTGPLNWPAPVSNTNTTIDDLWHAAVNGRGVYFSAKSPDSLVTGLSQSLEGIKARQGASAAASTSNMQPVPGDSFAYVALFNTVSWDGDLLAKEIDPVTSKFVKDPVNTTQDLVIWSAQAQLDPMVSAASDTRTIYTFDSSGSAAANKLKLFTWANLNATEQGYFSNICSSPYQLSQCPALIANDVINGTTNATAASGANLVNFLRGQHGFEDVVTNTSKIYRSRSHVLGDIVSAQPQYVRKPPFDYTDAGYANFKTAQANRTSTVYSGANDGMLHAFDGATGKEQWAYIPPMVMNNLYRLASEDYPTNHRYYVDGTPTVADICPNAPASTCTGTQWKTILVAGLNGGGRGYYALDITDPANPIALWNYTVADQANLGDTYGNPVIAKRKDNCTTLSGVTTCTGGTWVVAFTSGYNNVSPGDGKGHLFILNAYTGAPLENIVTTAGDSATPNPSGLSKINAWINDPSDSTAERYYGGDLLGNVWRFDIDNNVPPAGKEAFLLAQLGGVDLATVQPVTIKPELVEIVDGGGNSHAVVQVATGRYLGKSDLPNTDQQSVYSFKDNLTATGLGLVRTPGVLVKQTLTTYSSGGNFYRKSTNNPVNWATSSGWYVDLNPGGDSPGERVNVDMNMQQTTLQVTGNVPDTNACNVGGYSWLYYFNYQSGYLAPLAGIKDTANSLIAGTTQIQDATGKTHTIITHTDGSVTIQDDVSAPPPVGFSRRTSWRELTY
jgi:type IV pilus assembly protein PilY1